MPKLQEPVLFRGLEDDPRTLSSVLGEGAGAVSVCWENMPLAGIFDSTRARGIVEEMEAWINANYIRRV